MKPHLYHLGRHLTHPVKGVGVVTFEESDLRQENRMLRAVFASGQPVEGCAFYLRNLGVVFLDEKLSLPVGTASLNGHHGAVGFGYDEREAKKCLAREMEMAA